MQETAASESVDTLIIGCGMAGLAAGIRMAMFDRDVLILEQHNAPGGLNSFYFKDGIKYDVGLHAVTNFSAPGQRGAPLTKLLRQLRIPRESLDLSPQVGSRIAFAGANLRFGNGIELLQTDIERLFPQQIDGFVALRKKVLEFDAFDLEQPAISARAVLGGYLADPMLTDMLLCPLMYYGSARERDIDFDQFVTLWKALYEEGFARPFGGVRVIINALLERFREVGGKRRMRAPVRRILLDGKRAIGVELADGGVIHARRILSTAGHPETLRMCQPELDNANLNALIGRLSFAETINVLSAQPADQGLKDTIIFFNDSERFDYAASEGPVDLRSGVLCCPNNYQYGEGRQLDDGWVRVTAIANHGYWRSLARERYEVEKAAWFPLIVRNALRFADGVDADALLATTRATDMFTPCTIERFTGHFKGAVYGAPDKLRNGRTGYENLFLAGTDQGFLGIIGAMLSGISMANLHVLKAGD